MTDNMSTPEYQALDKEWQPKISAAFDEINFNEKLFQRVKSLYDRKASLGLDAKQDRLLTRTYDGFVRSGANLNAAQKAQLATMNQELATLFSTFNERLLADEGTYITATEAEMKGVPDDVKARACRCRQGAQAAGRHLCAEEHALGGRSGADLRRQPRAPREGVARVRQSRRQWRTPTTPTRSSPRS